jgi:hypothetical protein
MRLISMTDYVLNLAQSNSHEDYFKKGMMIFYAEFLTQPLSLEMFVSSNKEDILFEDVEIKEFGRVVVRTDFEDVTIANTKIGTMPNWKIEDLVKYKLILTDSASKQFCLES